MVRCKWRLVLPAFSQSSPVKPDEQSQIKPPPETIEHLAPLRQGLIEQPINPVALVVVVVVSVGRPSRVNVQKVFILTNRSSSLPGYSHNSPVKPTAQSHSNEPGNMFRHVAPFKQGDAEQSTLTFSAASRKQWFSLGKQKDCNLLKSYALLGNERRWNLAGNDMRFFDQQERKHLDCSNKMSNRIVVAWWQEMDEMRETFAWKRIRVHLNRLRSLDIHRNQLHHHEKSHSTLKIDYANRINEQPMVSLQTITIL